MVISGTRSTEAISKQIAMQVGTLKAEVSPQRKGEFVIATPTSVASVKGTVFWVTSDPVMGDVFYGMSGSVEVTNNESGAVVVVGANETGTSTPDGQVNVATTQEGVAPVDDEAVVEKLSAIEKIDDVSMQVTAIGVYCNRSHPDAIIPEGMSARSQAFRKTVHRMLEHSEMRDSSSGTRVCGASASNSKRRKGVTGF